MDGNRVGRQAGPQPAAGAMARSGPWDPNVIATLIASWAWTGRWTLHDALEELGDSAWATLTYSASFGLFLRRKTERLCSPSTLSALPELLRRCHGGAGWQQRRTLWMATNSPPPTQKNTMQPQRYGDGSLHAGREISLSIVEWKNQVVCNSMILVLKLIFIHVSILLSI